MGVLRSGRVCRSICCRTKGLKGFAQHHSAPLARAFCSSLKEHLNEALTGFVASSGPLLLDPKMTTNNIFSSLFLVEFLLFLAASKDNRWVTALLTEFGNGSKDVLENIGRVHREVLWQIALLENMKPDIEDGGSCSTSGCFPLFVLRSFFGEWLLEFLGLQAGNF